MRHGDTLPEGTRLTLDEFENLPSEVRGELVRGRLVREPPPRPLHGVLVARLARLLGDHVEQRALGVVISESGYVTEEEPPTVRGPDVSFVAAERLAEGLPDHWWRGAPDLAVEVLSPSDRPAATAEKVGEYLAAGARAVWVVDPARRAVTVHAPDAAPRELLGNAVLEGEPALPELRIPLPRLFAGVPRAATD